jgi:hypothetical protein
MKRKQPPRHHDPVQLRDQEREMLRKVILAGAVFLPIHSAYASCMSPLPPQGKSEQGSRG